MRNYFLKMNKREKQKENVRNFREREKMNIQLKKNELINLTLEYNQLFQTYSNFKKELDEIKEVLKRNMIDICQ